jgi:(S)-citramalyl-CoA lyase
VVLKTDKRDLASRTLPKSQRSIRSLKSLLFTPGTKSDHFNRAAGVHADALIIDLEDAVAISGKREAREASLRHLELRSINLPSVLRINAPDTRVGLDDLQALLNSAAEPDYLILPKCDSPATIRLIHNLLREADKSTQIIALIETAKGVGAVENIVGSSIKPAALLFALRIWRRTLEQRQPGNRCSGSGHASFKPPPSPTSQFSIRRISTLPI